MRLLTLISKKWILACAMAMAAPCYALAISRFIPLGDFEEGGFISVASAVSGDGSTVVGAGTRIAFGSPPDLSDAFLWSETIGLVNLQARPLFDAPFTRAIGVSGSAFDKTSIIRTRSKARRHFAGRPLKDLSD
jgi:hypothetical protein